VKGHDEIGPRTDTPRGGAFAGIHGQMAQGHGTMGAKPLIRLA